MVAIEQHIGTQFQLRSQTKGKNHLEVWSFQQLSLLESSVTADLPSPPAVSWWMTLRGDSDALIILSYVGVHVVLCAAGDWRDWYRKVQLINKSRDLKLFTLCTSSDVVHLKSSTGSWSRLLSSSLPVYSVNFSCVTVELCLHNTMNMKRLIFPTIAVVVFIV